MKKHIILISIDTKLNYPQVFQIYIFLSKLSSQTSDIFFKIRKKNESMSNNVNSETILKV